MADICKQRRANKMSYLQQLNFDIECCIADSEEHGGGHVHREHNEGVATCQGVSHLSICTIISVVCIPVRGLTRTVAARECSLSCNN